MSDTSLKTLVATYTGYQFNDVNLMKAALHHPAQGSLISSSSFQRLEFLGDRALSLAMGLWLYTLYPTESEGNLSRRLADLVCETTLADVARTINLQDWTLTKSEINNRILADTLEALLGAISLDADFTSMFTVVKRLWHNCLDQQCEVPQDSKSRLQEWSQARGLSLPLYTLVKATGPQHAPLFCSRVNLTGFESILGEGNTKKEAEKQAAAAFIRKHIESQSISHTSPISLSPDSIV